MQYIPRNMHTIWSQETKFHSKSENSSSKTSFDLNYITAILHHKTVQYINYTHHSKDDASFQWPRVRHVVSNYQTWLFVRQLIQDKSKETSSFTLQAFCQGKPLLLLNSPQRGLVKRHCFHVKHDVIRSPLSASYCLSPVNILKEINRVITGPLYTRDACCPRRARSLGRGRWCRRRNNRWRRASEGLPCTDRSGFLVRIRDHRRPESRTYWLHHTPGKKTKINSNGHMT